MKYLTSPFVQLALIVLIALVGAAGAIDNAHSALALGGFIALTALGLLGIGQAELRVKESAQPSVAVANFGALSLEARGAKLEQQLALFLQLLRRNLEANGHYSASLAQADTALASFAAPDRLRAIVGTLIEANAKMRRETSELSTNLQKSREQVAQLSSQLSQAQELVMLDPLTSLPNRRTFDAKLAEEIADARKRRKDLVLVMADLDHFKKVNDVFGHPFGDRVLKHFADLLARNTKGQDTAARLGGEEFAIILPQTSLASACVVIEQIRSRFESQQWMNEQTGKIFSKITASFGIVRLGEADDLEKLMKRADALLYKAKADGRNCIVAEAAA
jgi:diguanylate cyclase